MAIFDNNDTHARFASSEHKTGTVGAASELKKITDQLTKLGGGYTVTRLGSKA